VKLLEKRFDKNNEIDETLEEINRLNLELICLLAFDEKMNSFSDVERKPDSTTSKLIEAAEETNSNILPTDQGFQLWRLIETSEYKKIRESQEFMEKIAVEMVARKNEHGGDGNSLLDQYLKNPNLDVKDLYGMAADLLLAGVHTSSFTMAFALYHISKDQRVQDLIFQEALKVLPNCDDPITPTIINAGIPYTRSVLKETFRLNPISVGVGRILNKDTVFSGYNVPKSVNFAIHRYPNN
jgi:ecdysteroid 25-hydroxylase CYP302A1